MGLRRARDCPEQDTFINITPAANRIHKHQELSCLDDKGQDMALGLLPRPVGLGTARLGKVLYLECHLNGLDYLKVCD